MPRTARLVMDGGCYHVLTRGNNRAVVFHDHADFQHYCQLLIQCCAEHRVQVYHYCLMNNHVHLLLETAQARDLTKAMQSLNLSYALSYKRRYGHTGHLWQDRFKSLLIAQDNYLLQCGAYIEMNPVRARMVTSPEAYPWSSYRAYAFGERNPLVRPTPLYATLGQTAAERQARYREFVQGQLDVRPPDWLRHRAVGSSTFLEGLTARFGQLVVPRPRGRPRLPPVTRTHEK